MQICQPTWVKKKKICTKCGDEKLLTEFAWSNKKLGTRQSWCRGCVSERDKAEAPQRRAGKILTNKIGMEKRRIDGIQKVISYLLEHPCVDCGETDVLVLDFDHRDPNTKHDDIGRLVSLGYSWDVIKTEIDKCDVRCANDHRRKTARERNTLRWQYSRPILSGEGSA